MISMRENRTKTKKIRNISSKNERRKCTECTHPFSSQSPNLVGSAPLKAPFGPPSSPVSSFCREAKIPQQRVSENLHSLQPTIRPTIRPAIRPHVYAFISHILSFYPRSSILRACVERGRKERGAPKFFTTCACTPRWGKNDGES
jgi:hypothetical protein